jgi:hypothetical protein
MPVHTPTTKIRINGVPVYVKREDQYAPPIPLTYRDPVDFPAPPFAKTRGLLPHLQALRKRGVKTVAYMDTSISMASWGVAYCAPLADLHAIVYFPKYKDGPRHYIEAHAKRCTQLGAEVLYLEHPTQLAINWFRARQHVTEMYGDAHMLPQGLPFNETIESVAEEMKHIPEAALGGTIVTAIGSGTMAAGIITGLVVHHKIQPIHGILVNEASIIKTKHKIMKRVAGVFKGRLYQYITLYWLGHGYTDPVETPVPFPCNKYYDAKAWVYLIQTLKELEQPILFWNIGADINAIGT